MPRYALLLALTNHIGDAPVTPGVNLSVNDVPWEIADDWELVKPQNGPWRLTCQAWSDSIATSPELDDTITIHRDGILVFSGTVSSVRYGGIRGHGTDAVIAEINALDWNAIPARRVIPSLVLPPGTLRAALQAIVPYVDDVTLDPGQVDGPALPALTFSYATVQHILDQLTTATGYVWRVNLFKVLQMFLPGTVPAPFVLTESTMGLYTEGDLTVEPTRADYANRVFVLGTGVTGLAEDALEVAARRAWERVYESRETTAQSAVDALAQAALAASLPIVKTVEYRTLEWGLDPGQTQTINLPIRGVNNTFLLTEVAHRSVGGEILTRVRAIEGTVYRTGWREQLEIGGTGTVTRLTGVGGGGAIFQRYPRALATSWETGVRSAVPTWVRASAIYVQMDTVVRGTTDATIRASLRAFSPGISVQGRLFNLSTSQPCPGLSPVITDTAWTDVEWSVTLTPGTQKYCLELLSGAPDEDVYAVAEIQ